MYRNYVSMYRCSVVTIMYRFMYRILFQIMYRKKMTRDTELHL